MPQLMCVHRAGGGQIEAASAKVVAWASIITTAISIARANARRRSEAHGGGEDHRAGHDHAMVLAKAVGKPTVPRSRWAWSRDAQVHG